MEDEQETSYLRHRRKKSSISLSCCFHGPNRRFDSSDSSSSSSPMMSPVSSWFRSKGQHELPEVKGKSRNLMSRMGGRHARRHSGDFSYDPLSYALNFDTSSNTHFDDFTARLPVSPPRRRPSLSTQIRKLELPSPRKSAAPPKVKATEMPPPSPAAAAGGRGTVERTQAVVAREISVEY
ncbi:hypothetical protein RHGRI_005586 [Rhododendron griersonianum]|uniref:Uncharacterized protein n=1 Tax=Rhododendron griersonianum TaxID=479676 RepID=A0AAV6LD49_9ERIC|nr:hypothetical protein RHGRI_005586 [Rhododendron griersonianum]